MQPIFIINNHDYTSYLANDGIKPTSNDLDKEGAGRNLLNGLMYRNKIATKVKCTISFNRLSASIMSQLLVDMSPAFVSITMLDPKLNRHLTRTFYCSTINEGIQRYIGGDTVYDGVTFSITER